MRMKRVPMILPSSYAVTATTSQPGTTKSELCSLAGFAAVFDQVRASPPESRRAGAGIIPGMGFVRIAVSAATAAAWLKRRRKRAAEKRARTSGSARRDRESRNR